MSKGLKIPNKNIVQFYNIISDFIDMEPLETY